RFLLSAIRGDLQRSTIIVVQKHVAGMKQGTTRLQKSILGVRENHPPQGKTVWFNDATLTIERLQGILGRPVQNGTPDGCLEQKKFSFQYVRDITRKTSLDMTVSLMRGVLAKHQHYRRVGVITHRPQLQAIEKLEEFFRQRIVMSTYYGSGEERSSNAWYQECDLILVLGTPRVPSEAVMEYLIQVGEQRVACTEPTWDDVLWQATTHRGELKTLTGRGFHEELWRAAHRDLVRAALIQAIGRGRTVLEDGCDVIVLSNEECGLMVIDDETPRINDSAMEVLMHVQQLTANKSNIDILEKVAVNSQEIAQSLDRPLRTVRRVLTELESFHLIHRAGPRSGWMLSSPQSLLDANHSLKEVGHHVQCR
ncbi:aspartate/glutamate racemase family protein, partial [bacterium]|nr:aspartate/glutamate racemase family protein [bacterium]